MDNLKEKLDRMAFEKRFLAVTGEDLDILQNVQSPAATMSDTTTTPARVLHRYPGTRAEDWEQEAAGWKHKTATVSESATLGNYATVGEGAILGKYAIVGNYATVGEGAIVGKYATVGNYATVSEKAVWEESPLYIVGTRHIFCTPAPGVAQIGCTLRSYDAWETEGLRIAKHEGYTDAQIEEYRAYLNLAKLLHP